METETTLKCVNGTKGVGRSSSKVFLMFIVLIWLFSLIHKFQIIIIKITHKTGQRNTQWSEDDKWQTWGDIYYHVFYYHYQCFFFFILFISKFFQFSIASSPNCTLVFLASDSTWPSHPLVQYMNLTSEVHRSCSGSFLGLLPVCCWFIPLISVRERESESSWRVFNLTWSDPDSAHASLLSLPCIDIILRNRKAHTMAGN